jgi:hypothetical protein
MMGESTMAPASHGRVVSQDPADMMSETGQCCPVTVITSFDSHLVVPHVVVTVIMSSALWLGGAS